MKFIVVNIFSGNFIVATARVGLINDSIHQVELSNDQYMPVSPVIAEAQRKFWTQEYQRLGWDFTPESMIAKAVGMELMHRDYVHESVCDWMDTMFEDRMEAAGF